MLIVNKIDAGEFRAVLRKANSLLGTLSVQYAYANLYANKLTMCTPGNIRACLYVYLYTLELWDNTTDAINYVTEDEFYTIYTKLTSLITSCGICLPTVNVGPNQSIAIAASTAMTAVASSPNGPIVSYLWKVMSGPGAITFSNQTGSQTNLSGFIEGSYVIRCTVTDYKGLTAYDEAVITVAGVALLVYYGIGTTPTDQAGIIAGSSQALPGSPVADVSINYVPLEPGSPDNHWFAIPVSIDPRLSWIVTAGINEGPVANDGVAAWKQASNMSTTFGTNYQVYDQLFASEYVAVITFKTT